MAFIYKFSLPLFLFHILNNIFYQKIFLNITYVSLKRICIHRKKLMEINLNAVYFEAAIIVKYLIRYMCANVKYKIVSRN